MSAAKSKRMSKGKRRKVIRKQIGYLEKNLKAISELTKCSSLLLLDKPEYKNLLVISEVLRQQKWMYEQREHRVDDRIVSVSQPHVRPSKYTSPEDQALG